MRLLPKIITYTTMGIDGRIGYPDKRIVLSSICDLKYLHRLRASVDAIMVGANTVIVDDPILTPRYINKHLEKYPYRIVVDGKLSTPLNARVYDTNIAPTILITSYKSSRYKKELLRNKGVEVIEAPLHRNSSDLIDLREALRIVKEKFPKINTVLVEGGGKLLTYLILNKLVDKIIVSLAPVILGKRGICIFQAEIDQPIRLKVDKIETLDCGPEIIVHLLIDF